MSTQKNEFDKAANAEKGFDIKKLVARVINNWLIFLISLVFFGAIAFVYIRYGTPSYKINSLILIDESSSGGNAGDQILKSSSVDFSSLFDLSSNAYNEVEILQSRILITNTVKALDLNVTTYASGKLFYNELYDEAPFKIKLVSKVDTIEERNLLVDINKNVIHLKCHKDNIDTTFKFGQVVRLPQYDVILTPVPGKPVDPRGYKVNIKSVDQEVDELMAALTVELTDTKSTMLSLTFKYPNPKKGEVILQKLMDLYLLSGLEKKTQIADSTLAFIDGQLSKVSVQLSSIEGEFAKFQQQNKLASVDEQGKVLVDNVSIYYNRLSDIQVQISILNDVEKYISDSKNPRIIPSSFSVPDPVFATAIGKYNDLLVSRDQLALSYKNTNPVVKATDDDIENVRQSLVKSFDAYRQSLLVSVKDLKAKNESLNDQVAAVPQKERVFLDYTREQNLAQDVDLYLLQKREETELSKKSTVNSSSIADPAKADYLPYIPKTPLIVLLGLFLGLLIPAGYLYTIDLLNIKILNKNDIETNSHVAILGEIGNNSEGQSLIVNSESRSVLSEQFRALRTNLQFVVTPGKCNVLLITSSMSGEGKSFISINLASVLALSGKKVVLMELDLRKPKMSVNLGMDNSYGFTSYIVSEDMDINSIVKPTFFSENCFIISSGLIPPNPAELLLSDKVETMIAELKKQFDYIIIDTAPIGLVSDAQIIEKYADLNLYVVRQEYTYKSQLNIINDLTTDGKFKRSYLVVNDIKAKKGGYYGYGYGYGHGYGYGYGYGYGADVEKTGLWSKIKKGFGNK